MSQLRITLLAGLILFLLAGCVLTVFILIERSGSASVRAQDTFSRILREFDADFNDLYFTELEIYRLHGELDKLEKRAISVESWLSILKRRRAFLPIHPASISNYRTSIENALKVYPASQPINAIAAASLVKDTAINRETEFKLRDFLPFITEPVFNSLRIGLHVILGDFNNPQRAEVLPLNLLPVIAVEPENILNITEIININLAVLKTLRGNYREAASDVQMLLNSYSPSNNALRFAAEYHYDFGNLQRSAEIFSLINDEAAMIRQADALYLAGYTEMASAIWYILADLQNETSLYNLAITAEDQVMAAGFLRTLVNIETSSNSESRQFGLIRYSRLLDYSDALSLLRGSVNFSPEDYPYIDLEICKRHAQGQHLGRQLAETWLLLDRHEKNEELYKWAIWHLFFQKSFDETRILLDRMNILQIDAPWVDVYNAIQLMNEGFLDSAESILRGISPEDVTWAVYANLGKIMEIMLSPARAIEQYELAAAKISLESQNRKNAARIQLQIAKSFSILNRFGEARRALLFAHDLDPENLTISLELDKLF